MTRFARAKGSKASNEKLPESATSWSEMKRELFNKNKDLEEQEQREKAIQQRDANYQAFLQEKEDEEVKNTSWADFPEAQYAINMQSNFSTFKKQKLTLNNNEEVKSLHPGFKNKKKKVDTFVGKNKDVEFGKSDEIFAVLKSHINKALDNQQHSESDSDAPPQEASIREKPKEIIVKKTKKPKKILQILTNRKDKSNNTKDKKNTLEKTRTESELKKRKPKENLSDKEKKRIEKKQERYKKQLEKKKLKRHEKTLKIGQTINDHVEINNDIVTEQEFVTSQNVNDIDAKKLEKKLERRKKQKEKKLKKKLEKGTVNTLEYIKKDEVLTEKDLANIQKKKERRARQAEKRKKFREAKVLAAENAETNKVATNDQTTNANEENNNLGSNLATKNGNRLKINKVNTDLSFDKSYEKPQITKKEKKPKLKEKEFQRTRPKPETMFINGNTIEIDYVDGFPVKKEDADRLKKLRKEMISKGLPRSEINISLKLERRRAEKALAREKKNVCFNCRKAGHNLSECPELNKDQVVQTSGTGICFKCGSTEHTHYACKIVKGLEYKFATCFICKEQGHISRQCPDNQRGIYPKGGACNVCGDVTHLKKDCPKFQAQQAQLQSGFSIETLDNRNPDDLGSKGESKNAPTLAKKLNKIKF